MLTTKYSKRFRSIVSVSLLLLLTSAAICQSQPPASTKQGKKSKTNAESCDGAADIVPVKPMSFARKRRPSAKEQSKEQSGEAKPNNI